MSQPDDFYRGPKSEAEVRTELDQARVNDLRWNDLRNLRASYFAGDDVVRVATDAFTSYLGRNALYGAVAYPSLTKLEADVVAILLKLFQAPSGAGGGITTGGTESIFLAVKTARDWGVHHRPSSKQPTILLARSGHPAFDKAAKILGMRTVRIPVTAELKADVAAMARAIDESTVMIVGSAPPYAYGVIDPLSEISDLALRHGLWMHVDACVGGMVLPFIRDLGRPLPPFDFALPAVSSISVDLHKYGYAFHGCSALLLRSEELAAFQRYQFDSWPVGLYSTRGFVGSRGGGPVASAWAVMNYLGFRGYRDRVERMLKAKDRLIEGIGRIDGLEVWGRPDATLLSLGSKRFDMDLVSQVMKARGWAFAKQTEPKGMLLLLNGFHEVVIDEFLADLAKAASDVSAGRVSPSGESAIYTT